MTTLESRKKISHPRDDLCLPFLSPFSDLGVDLITEFGFNLSCVTGKEGKEPLGTTVDDIYFMQRDRVYDLSSLLNFSLRALNELGLHRLGQRGYMASATHTYICTHCVIIS